MAEKIERIRGVVGGRSAWVGGKRVEGGYMAYMTLDTP
jgi:hypothetical protein